MKLFIMSRNKTTLANYLEAFKCLSNNLEMGKINSLKTAEGIWGQLRWRKVVTEEERKEE